jgi:hypothetical protein
MDRLAVQVRIKQSDIKIALIGCLGGFRNASATGKTLAPAFSKP